MYTREIHVVAIWDQSRIIGHNQEPLFWLLAHLCSFILTDFKEGLLSSIAPHHFCKSAKRGLNVNQFILLKPLLKSIFYNLFYVILYYINRGQYFSLRGAFLLGGLSLFDPQSAWYIAFCHKSNCRITNVHLWGLKQFEINHSTPSYPSSSGFNSFDFTTLKLFSLFYDK